MPSNGGASRTILVVEDDAASRELIEDWLTGEGFEVKTENGLAAGIATVANCRPDAILLDIRLGKDDGTELASWMRRRPEFAQIPVIAVTAHAMMTEQKRVLDAGCNACVSKPIDFALLRATLERFLLCKEAVP